MQTIQPEGSIPSRIMIIGEAPGYEEERAGFPFVGTMGAELSKMLHEAGIIRSECFLTTVVRSKPPGYIGIDSLIAQTKKGITPQHVVLQDKHVLPPIVEGCALLQREIAQVKPQVIIACGNLSLWALTGEWGVMKWRGSELPHKSGAIVIPVYHPSMVIRQWELRAITVNDLRRAKRVLENGSIIPNWRFTIKPSFTQVTTILNNLIKELSNVQSTWDKWLDFDLETRAAHITCAGISWSSLDGLCIPLTCTENKEGYWSESEEASIIFLLYKLMTNPLIKIRGQNLLYDAQYTYRHWHFIPRVVQDTMISQHTCFSGMKKSLAFQASMYCEYYRYWKEDHQPGGFKAGD